MKCPFCGNEFTREESAASCKGCPVPGGCHMVRCPRCGYEIPEEPGLIRAIKSWRERRNAAGRKS